MSTAQEELKEIEKQAKELKEEQEKGWIKERELANRREKIVASVILESGLLSKLRWRYTSRCNLDMIRSNQYADVVNELHRIAGADYHHNTVLVPGDVTTGEENTTTFDAKIVLAFDDNDLHLGFRESPATGALMVEFIKSQNLKVDFGPLLRDYNEAKERLANLETIVAFFGVKP